MRLIAHITWLYRKEIGDSLFFQLAEIYPRGVTGNNKHAFKSNLPADDPITIAILDALRRSNYVPWHPSLSGVPREPGRHYQIILHREYEQVELEQFRLFEFGVDAEAGVYGVRRNSSGSLDFRLPVSPDDVDTTAWDFLTSATYNHWYICPSSVKEALASQNLLNLRFGPVDMSAMRYPPEPLTENEIHNAGGPFWELTTDFTLPPVSPAVELTNRDHKRVWPGPDSNLIRVGGLFGRPELHYKASDLRAMEPFDIARTHESFGGIPQRNPDYCPIIVSKRFYNVCQQHNFKIDWLPVHIDPI